MDWKTEIVIAHKVKREIAASDTAQIWPQHFPNVAASPESIDALERYVGFKLSSCHREFLLHSDGWRGFFQHVDIFGVSELSSGTLQTRAAELLKSLEDVRSICGFEATELWPIAVSTTDIDLFAITKPSSRNPGIVLWFAGQEIDRFSTFCEWFLAMTDYNRRECRRIKGMLEAL